VWPLLYGSKQSKEEGEARYDEPLYGGAAGSAWQVSSVDLPCCGI
jgi:hypothetical protein